MKNWRNFFLQRMGTTSNNAPYPMYESVKAWGMWCSEIPFAPLEKVKDLPKRSWYDEHGDDEFIPSGGLFLESYEMKVKFGCKKMGATSESGETIPAVTNVRENVKNFLNYLRTSGMMMIYSSYTRIGRQNVRFVGYSDDANWVSEGGQEFLVFEVTLKVNDPITEIVKNQNQLVVST